MRMYIQVNPQTGEILRVSPVQFSGAEELDIDEDHPFIQELMQCNINANWKNINGELKKIQPELQLNVAAPNSPKLDLKPMIQYITQHNGKHRWQTPWESGLFFITDPHDSWRIWQIFEMPNTGVFETDEMDFQLFQLFSITHNNEGCKEGGHGH